MRFEVLIQFIVPLTFLAIWALTTLLNRDAQPLPPRPGRTPSPRPDGTMQRPVDPRTLSGDGRGRPSAQGRATERPASRGLRQPFGSSPRPRFEDRQELSPRDAIVFIEGDPSPRQEPLSSGTTQKGFSLGGRQRGPGLRRSGRSRSSEGKSSGQPRSETEPQRALTNQLQESMALQRTRPLEIAPLGSPMKRLGRPFLDASVTTASTQVEGTTTPVSLSAEQIRKLIANPGRLREVAVLSEILLPPVSMRRRR